MKFAATALILGSAALACKPVVCPDPVNQLAGREATVDTTDIGLALGRLGFDLPRFLATKTAVTNLWNLPKAPEPKTGPNKAEAILLIHAAAAKHGVPPAFVKSIVQAESNFNYAALSPKGAIGFMQLMPETAEEFGADPTVPEQNIDAGTRYLRWLMNRYAARKSSLKNVIAAYNAGPGNVDRYRGVPPFRETRRYVTRVLGYMRQYQSSRNPS